MTNGYSHAQKYNSQFIFYLLTLISSSDERIRYYFFGIVKFVNIAIWRCNCNQYYFEHFDNHRHLDRNKEAKFIKG